MRVAEQIPEALRPEVEAALAWLRAVHRRRFEVTAIADPEQVESRRDGPHDLTLILCDGDLCVREQVRVHAAGAGFEIEDGDAVSGDPPARMDPLPGARRGWLDAALGRYAFVVLVFYRGFW